MAVTGTERLWRKADRAIQYLEDILAHAADVSDADQERAVKRLTREAIRSGNALRDELRS